MTQQPAIIDPSPYNSLGELIRDALLQFKGETALIEADRKSELARYSYQGFQHAAERVARVLQDRGIGAGSRVAILMSNQSKWLLAAYGALFRGAVLVPIDYKMSAGEQRTLIEHAQAQLVVTEYPLWRRFDPPLHCPVIVSDWPGPDAAGARPHEAETVLGWEQAQKLSAAAPTFVPRERSDTATIVYSSGTAGRPKGCMLSHDNYLEQLRSLLQMFPLSVGDRYFSILPTNHAIDFMCGFVGPLCGGAAIVHQRTLRPELILHTMRQYQVTHMALVPLVLTAFERAIREKLDNAAPAAQQFIYALRKVNASLTAKRPKHGLSRRLLSPVHDAFGGQLKLLFCGGAFVDPKRARFFYELGLPVVIGYGLTEACTVVTVNDLRPFRADSVGRPVAGVEVEVRDVEGASGVGEVWVRGRTVMQGYLNDPQQTAEVLLDGWLRTGDRGYLDAAGHLHLVGRSKNMIVTAGGKNIYPEDVESSLEDISCEELAVFSSNYLWPMSGLVAESLICAVRGFEAGQGALLAAFRDRNRHLPEHKRLGGVLVVDEPFPRTASMKVKRERLAEQLRRSYRSDAVLSLEASSEPLRSAPMQPTAGSPQSRSPQ